MSPWCPYGFPMCAAVLPQVSLSLGGAVALRGSVGSLRALWEETSFQLERLQTEPRCVAEEEKALRRRQGAHFSVSFPLTAGPPPHVGMAPYGVMGYGVMGLWVMGLWVMGYGLWGERSDPWGRQWPRSGLTALGSPITAPQIRSAPLRRRPLVRVGLRRVALPRRLRVPQQRRRWGCAP